MSTTLSDRLTRGTYLFDNGPDQPGVICLSYSWMSDAMKVLPLSPDQRVHLMLNALKGIYPELELASHIVGDPITVSWENDPGFLGASKARCPATTATTAVCSAPSCRNSWPRRNAACSWPATIFPGPPAGPKGRCKTALNAVWGIMHHFGGATPPENPGPGDLFDRIAPIQLPD